MNQGLRQVIVESDDLKGYQHPRWCFSVEYQLPDCLLDR